MIISYFVAYYLKSILKPFLELLSIADYSLVFHTRIKLKSLVWSIRAIVERVWLVWLLVFGFGQNLEARFQVSGLRPQVSGLRKPTILYQKNPLSEKSYIRKILYSDIGHELLKHKRALYAYAISKH